MPDITIHAERWRRAIVVCLTGFAASLPLSHVPAQLFLASAFIAWVGWGVVMKGVQWRRDALLVPIGAYLLWNIISAVLSERPAHTLWAIVDNEWPMLVCLMMVWSVRTEAELKRILSALFICSSIAFLYGFLQVATGMDYVHGRPMEHMIEGKLYRATGFSGYPLTFAGFAMSVFFLSAGSALGSQEKTWKTWVVPLLAVAAILATYSRSIWVAMAFLIPWLAFRWGRRRGWQTVGGFIIVAFTMLLVSDTVRTRVWAALDPSQNETRLNLWRTSFRMIADHPLFGIGQDNFTLFFDRYRVEGFYDTFVHPHNDYISVMVHGGIAALVAFLAIWVIILRRGWHTAMKISGTELGGIALGAFAGIVGFMISATFQNYYGTFVNCFNWWMIAGIILTAYQLSADDQGSRM